MNFKTIGPFVLAILLFQAALSQDCTLGIGGKDTETIIEVFQLNAEQRARMEDFRAAMSVETKVIEEEEKMLLEKHPQTTADDLTKLAEKYKALQARLMAISITYDKKLLALFNERQYQRYVSLCREALRKPLVLDPKPH
jgi:predicted phage gp36 major capsid-like protein